MATASHAPAGDAGDDFLVERPVWRRFSPRFVTRAAAWAKKGGAAAVLDGLGALVVVLPTDARGRATTLARWAMWSIDERVIRRARSGPFEGLRIVPLAGGPATSVLDWCERDAMHEGPTRTLSLDCLACGACCHDAEVLLDERDLDRYRRGNRPDLASDQRVERRADGTLALRLVAAKPLARWPHARTNERCPELGDDLRCASYRLRPDNCRAFLRGSEACLAAREDTLSLRDGLAAGD